MSITGRLIPACLNVSPSTAAFAWKDSGNDIFSYAQRDLTPRKYRKTRLLPLL